MNMLYTEFIEGTGCKENEHNYKVYKDLEVMYMNSGLTKQEIYEYVRKLVDNRKSEEEIEADNKIKAEINTYKDEIKVNKERIELYETFVKLSNTAEEEKSWKENIKRIRAVNTQYRREIKKLRFIMELA